MESTLQIFDIQERDVGSPKPPSFPTPPTAIATSATGFPVHKKRVSAFKKQMQSQTAIPVAPTAHAPDIPKGGNKKPDNDKETINRENQQVINNMSPQEIAEAQKELFNALDPSLIQMLMRRANLDEDTGPSAFDLHPPSGEATRAKPDTPSQTDPAPPEIRVIEDTSKIEPESIRKPKESLAKPKKTVRFDDENPDSQPTTSSAPITNPDDDQEDTPLPPNTTHFPHGPSVPDLDPSDPDFLANLHQKYFPSLPADPSKLAWMSPLPTPNSAADRESPYYPSNPDFPVSALRFDFRGRLLPPRVSRRIPVTKGLHHHGEAPEAAGYTIPELARLARSAVPGQRCIAYQTLGRMLFRLGKGEWGKGEGGRVGEEDDLAFGLWRCFREGRVLESLEEEAGLPEGKGHMSSKAYATEALWLFEKGGWREKWRGL